MRRRVQAAAAPANQTQPREDKDDDLHLQLSPFEFESVTVDAAASPKGVPLPLSPSIKCHRIKEKQLSPMTIKGQFTWQQARHRHGKFLAGICVVLLLGLLHRGLRWAFPKTIYHKLLAIPQVHQLLEEAPAPHEEQYVVIVATSNGKQQQQQQQQHTPFHVSIGKSRDSAEAALQHALQTIPLRMAANPWFQIDIVNAVKKSYHIDTTEPLDAPSWWYGLALDWDLDWVFTPVEVATQRLVDSNHRLRWDHIGEYARQRRTLKDFPTQLILEDDTTVLPHLHMFHTTSIWVDVRGGQHVTLHNGHRRFDTLTHRLLMDAAIDAGSYLIHRVEEDGRFQDMTFYPRSNTTPEKTAHQMLRHAGTLYSMACLYMEWPDASLKRAMQRSMMYLSSRVQECPLPLKEKDVAKCVWDVDDEVGSNVPHHISTLGMNALAVLAMAEYQHATGDDQYFEIASDLARWIHGAQQIDGSFVQKVQLLPSFGVDDEYKNRYYPGMAAFALARLYRVADPSQQHPAWLRVAKKSADWVIDQDSALEDEDVPVDSWLMNAIAEMYAPGDDTTGSATRVDHAMKLVDIAQSDQIVQTGPDEDKDLLGTFGADSSGSGVARKTEGICAVYHVSLGMEFMEKARTIEKVTSLSQRFLLQSQYRPEQTMYMKDARRALGGFRRSLTHWDMRSDYTQHNLNSLLCMARMVKEMEVSWTQ